MLQTNDNWCVNIDRGVLNGVIFIDLKKAFDTNDHEIILKKLTKYGDDQDVLKTKEIASFKNPTCLFLRSFQGTAASFAIQIGVFSITLEPLLPSPCAAFSQLFNSRSIHFGDVSEMNARETPSLFRSDHVTRNALAAWKRLGKNLSTTPTLGTEESDRFREV